MAYSIEGGKVEEIEESSLFCLISCSSFLCSSLIFLLPSLSCVPFHMMCLFSRHLPSLLINFSSSFILVLLALSLLVLSSSSSLLSSPPLLFFCALHTILLILTDPSSLNFFIRPQFRCFLLTSLFFNSVYLFIFCPLPLLPLAAFFHFEISFISLSFFFLNT